MKILWLLFLLSFAPHVFGEPNIAKWEAAMLTYGERYAKEAAAALPAAGTDPATALTYYDAARVFENIRTYTGDPKWGTARSNAAHLYRKYAENAAYRIPAYWVFPHGLLADSANAASKTALIEISKNAAFALDTTPLASTEDATSSNGGSRENAYILMAYIAAEKAGAPRRPLLQARVDQAVRHLEQFAGVRPVAYVRPFMMSLTAEALIYAHEHDSALIGEATLREKLRAAADYAVAKCWRPASRAFTYTDRSVGVTEDLQPAPDLNLLIAPVFAWLKDPLADDIFNGGVDGAFLGNAKQFNQNYRWSFDFVKWRKVVPPVSAPKRFRIVGGEIEVEEVK